jgi:hypothetical protein
MLTLRLTLFRLAAVNFFLFCANGVQVFRVLNYRRSVKQGDVEAAPEAAKAA